MSITLVIINGVFCFLAGYAAAQVRRMDIVRKLLDLQKEKIAQLDDVNPDPEAVAYIRGVQDATDTQLVII